MAHSGPIDHVSTLVGLLPVAGLALLKAMPQVRTLCLHQPDPATSGGIELHMPPQPPDDDPYTPLWQHLAASSHLTSLSLLGSFALLLTPTTSEPPPPPQPASHTPTPRQHGPTNATDLDLDYFFGETPSPDITSQENPEFIPTPSTHPLSPPPPLNTTAAAAQPSANLQKPRQATAYPHQTTFTSALVALAPSLRSLTLQNAPLTPPLCAALAQLTHLTHLDVSASEKVFTAAGGRAETVRRPDCETWAAWRHQGSTHQTQHVALPHALRHCTALHLSRLQGLQQLSVRGQQGLPWSAIESVTALTALTALDVAHCIDMPNTAIYQVRRPCCNAAERV